MTRATWTGLGVVAATSAFVFASPTETPPQPQDPARDAARIELGRRLFFDPVVSRGGRVACASCHDPAHGFTDKAHPSADEWGNARRRTMPLADLDAGPFHADGEFPAVRNLLDARLAPLPLLRELRKDGDRVKLAGDEASFPTSYGASKADPPALVRVADRLSAGGLYATAFRDAFGDATPTHDRICDAVEAYVRALKTSVNPLDRFLGGDDAALSVPATHGLALFTGKAGCAQCHDVRAVDGRAPLRDGKFHDTGVSFRTAAAAGRSDVLDRADIGLAEHADSVAERRRQVMMFKTPSLRDVARRGPFMHDGSLATLADVVDFYDRGAAPHDGQDPLIKRLGLSPQEKDDLVAFLLALSGDERPGIAAAPAGARTLRVRLVDPTGRPLAGVPFEAESAGDRFRGAPEAPEVRAILTDEDGRASCDFPPSTHVRLRADRYVVTGLVPDCAGEAELIAVPVGQVAMRVRAAPKMLPTSVRATPLEKQNAKGQVIAKRDGDTIVFALARRLSDAEGLYVAAAPRDGSPASRRDLVPSGSSGGALPATVDMDLTGGATTGVDLTPLAHAKDTAEPGK